METMKPLTSGTEHHLPGAWYLTVAAALLALAAIFFINARFVDDYLNTQSKINLVSKDQSVAVRISFYLGDKERMFEGKARENLTLKDALLEIAGISGISVKIAGNDLIGIERYAKNKNKAWAAYVNGKPLSGSLLVYQIKGGDRIVLRYE
jgi:hypothetical protein